MPKTKISEYSVTNSSNTDIEGINIDEGCAPSGINNAIRELMVHLKEFQTGASGDAFTFAGGVLISGTANTITGNVLMSGTNTITGSTTATFAAGAVGTPSIAAHGDTNTGIFFPAADTIAFSEGGAEAMRIDSSGNVGIGTSSPSYRLTVSSAQSTAANNTATGSAVALNGLYVRQRGLSNGISGNPYTIQLFADPAADNFEIYNAATNYALVFGTNTTERARIPAAGGFQCVNSISVGNATPSTSGAGITFPATQSASSDANTLDDYEEGTFTVAVRGSGTAGTYELSESTGYYTKIGNQVTFWLNIKFASSITGGGSGYMQITGFPFANAVGGVTCTVSSNALDLSAGYTWVVAGPISSSGVTTWFLAQCGDNVSGLDFPISGVSGGDGVTITGTFRV